MTDPTAKEFDRPARDLAGLGHENLGGFGPDRLKLKAMAVRVVDVEAVFALRPESRAGVVDLEPRGLAPLLRRAILVRGQIERVVNAAAVRAEGLHLIGLNEQDVMGLVRFEQAIRRVLRDEIAADHVEPEDIPVEGLRPVQIGHLQQKMIESADDRHRSILLLPAQGSRAPPV